jgi:hypothetical protein
VRPNIRVDYGIVCLFDDEFDNDMVRVVDADLSDLDLWTPVTPAAVTMERKQPHHYGPLTRF